MMPSRDIQLLHPDNTYTPYIPCMHRATPSYIHRGDGGVGGGVGGDGGGGDGDGGGGGGGGW